MTETQTLPYRDALWRSIIRNAQTYLPARLQEHRLDAQQRVNTILRRPHEAEFRALNGHLAPGAHVLDLGANRGQSIDSINLLRVPGLTITAFEPQYRLAARLTRRYPDVNVVNAGVGAANGTMTLYTPSYRGYRFDGLASTDYESATSWFSYAVRPYNPDLITVDVEQIPICTLDSLDLAPVDFIKIDVQEMELAALQGATALLERDRPLLMLEAPDNAAVAGWLAAHGYDRFDAVDGVMVPSNGGHALNAFFEHHTRHHPGRAA